MKKLASLVMATLMMALILLTGCSSSDNKGAGTTEKKSEVKVGFLYVGPPGDGGWTYSHDQARKYLEKETGVKTIVKESVKEDPAEVAKVCEDMINQGANVIIGTSYGFMDGMATEAKKHLDVKFMHCSGNKSSENMLNYFGRMYEMRYLSGIVAAMKTKTSKIGYVAAFPTPEVVGGIDAFALGVQSIKKDAIVKVKWTNTWYDPAKEKEAGKALVAEGVDVITQHQDTAGPQQAAEEAGISSIGYSSDMKAQAPKAYMTAPLWNWGPYYVKQIKAIQNGTWKSVNYLGGIEDKDIKAGEEIIDLAPLTENASAGAAEKVKAVREDIKSGRNKVYVGPIQDQTGAVKVPEGKVMTDEEILSVDWFVKGVEGKIEK